MIPDRKGAFKFGVVMTRFIINGTAASWLQPAIRHVIASRRLATYTCPHTPGHDFQGNMSVCQDVLTSDG